MAKETERKVEQLKTKTVETIRGKTSTDFEYEFPKENLDNYELVEALADAEENALALPRVVNLLLGKKYADKLKDHVRTDTGVVPSEKLFNEVMEIFQSQKEAKNS